jgi:hypothetical protein
MQHNKLLNDALKKIKEDPMVAVQAAQLAQLKAALERKKLMKQIEEKEKERRKKRKEEEEKKRKRNDEQSPILEGEKRKKRRPKENHGKSCFHEEDRKLREEEEEEERRRKREQMINDGKIHEMSKRRDILKREEERQRDYREFERSIPQKDAKTAAFLTKFHSEAYLNSGHSLEERIGRNLNRIDRRSKIEE